MLNAIIELKAIKVLYKELWDQSECNQALVVDIDMIQKIIGGPWRAQHNKNTQQSHTTP